MEMPNIEIHTVARICHEANRVYCAFLGDDSQKPWGDAPEWQRNSAINGVQFHVNNPDAGDEASHESWRREKAAHGWTYGDRKDEVAKTHPCMVDFRDLPLAQQWKDRLFRTIVHAAFGRE